MKVRPVIPGTIIRDPHTRRPLPEEGGEVVLSTFWIRRLRASEVILIEESAPTGLEPVTPLTTRGNP